MFLQYAQPADSHPSMRHEYSTFIPSSIEQKEGAVTPATTLLSGEPVTDRTAEAIPSHHFTNLSI